MVPQTPYLLGSELEHEVAREPIEVTLDGSNEGLGFHLVQRGEVGIEHHARSTQPDYRPMDAVDRAASPLTHGATIAPDMC